MFLAEERTRDGKVLLSVPLPDAAAAWKFWADRMSAAAPAGTYAPHAPRRLVLKREDSPNAH